MTVLVSACLLGVSCRYDGQSKGHPLMGELLQKHTVIPICPEQLGGLSTPRPPAERRGGGVFTREGADVTAAYDRGARETLRLARLYSCSVALFKERSPACGSGQIYDGSFTKTLVDGYGAAAELLEKNGGRLDTGACRVVLRLPYDQGGVVDMLHRQAKVERVDYGEAIEVEAVCTPVQLGRLKDYIVSGWTPPKEPWED